MKLIVGLGNPGEKYKNTRHNLGFLVLNEFVKKMDGGGWKIEVEDRDWKVEEKFKVDILKVNDERLTMNDKLILAKPLTYMNNSGMAVKLLADYFKIKPQDIIVIHDDLDLVLNKIKIRLGGAAAGHHGVESIIKALDTDKFIRVRLGIGNLKTQLGERKKEHINAEKFVLEPFMKGEKSKLKQMLKKSTQALEVLLQSKHSLSEGLEKAQNQFN